MPDASAAAYFRFRSVALRFLWSLMFLTTTSAARSQDIHKLWHGVGIQGTDSQWTTEVDLRIANPSVRYPSLHCSGQWTKIGEDHGIYEYAETISVGRKTCVDGYLKVRLLTETRLSIEYSETRAGPPIAKAVVFPGKHHVRRQRHMIEITRAFIDDTAVK